MNSSASDMTCNKDYICLEDRKMKFPEIIFYVLTGIVLTSVCVLTFYVMYKGFMVVVSDTPRAT